MSTGESTNCSVFLRLRHEFGRGFVWALTLAVRKKKGHSAGTLFFEDTSFVVIDVCNLTRLISWLASQRMSNEHRLCSAAHCHWTSVRFGQIHLSLLILDCTKSWFHGIECVEQAYCLSMATWGCKRRNVTSRQNIECHRPVAWAKDERRLEGCLSIVIVWQIYLQWCWFKIGLEGAS